MIKKSIKKALQKVATVFAEANARNTYGKITEDRYSTYGVSEYLHRQSVEESAVWIKQFISHAVFMNKKRDLYAYAAKKLQHLTTAEDLLFLEFGVATGTSINFFAGELKTKIYGFDSFEGLPDDWKGWNAKAGMFSMHGNLPKVAGNVELVKGMIEDTLPPFLEKHKNKKIAFIHVDTDLYEPAKIILSLCKPRLGKGSLILFDELHSYTSWQLHEYKALQEELNPAAYRFIAFSDYKQGLLEIL